MLDFPSVSALSRSEGNANPSLPADNPATSRHYEGYSLGPLTDTVFLTASRRCTITINPKSACSTLKLHVWRQDYEMGATPWEPPVGHGGIHRKEQTPLYKASVRQMDAALFEKPIFSIVRNPYTRLLSAYLDKISIKLKRPKRQLLVQMGRVEDAPVSFGEFVEFACGQNSRQMNPHYAPQSFLMQVHYHPFSYIGCVEAMEESLSAIMAMAYDVKLKTQEDYRPHRTDASSLIEKYFTPEIAAKIFDRFRVDFDVFGYDADLDNAYLPPQNLKSAAQIGSRLAESVLRPALRAEVALEAGAYATALDYLCAVTHDEPELDALRARLLMKVDRNEEALSQIQRAVERVDDIGRYWMLLSECLLALGRSKEASEAADQAVAVAPYPGMMRSAVRVWRANDRAIAVASYAGAIRAATRMWDRKETVLPEARPSVKRIWKSEKVAAYKERIASAEALEKSRHVTLFAKFKDSLRTLLRAGLGGKAAETGNRQNPLQSKKRKQRGAAAAELLERKRQRQLKRKKRMAAGAEASE
jgi:tetratricopeptide (TPR) repeat protein